MEEIITFHLPDVDGIIAAVIAVCALFVSAFVSASEIAFFSISPEQIADLEEDDEDSASRRVLKLLKEPERLLATILITNNLVNISIVILLNIFMEQIMEINSGVLNFVIQSVILTFLILLFGEIVPKLYARNNNVSFARIASSPLKMLSKIFSPLSKLLIKSTVIVNKVYSAHDEEISTEDLSKALEITKVGNENEREMLEGILRFGDTTVAEIMRPRVDIGSLDIRTKFSAVVEFVIKSGYSRIPVCEGNLDNIKGILFSKDLLPFIGKVEDDFKWQRLLKDAYIVPESRMIDDLLEDFRNRKRHIAIVVDEFGGTQGLVTLEDIMEEIVGDINDEYDEEEELYKQLPDGSYIFDGKTLLNDFCRITDSDDDVFDEIAEEVDTLAGLLLELKGDFPKEKEPIAYRNFRFLVLKIEKHRIAKVRVKIAQEEEGNEK